MRFGVVRRSAAILLVAAHGSAVFAQSPPVPPAALPGSAPPLDPSAPLSELPDLGVAWPELDKPDANIPNEAPATATVQVDEERRYAIKLAGLDAVDGSIATRFAETSVLDQNDGKPANAAQIERRAEEDTQLLRSLLRSQGYYDAEVSADLAAQPDQTVLVTLTAEPGPLYKFAEITTPGLAQTGVKEPEFRDAFPVATGDPVEAETVIGGQAALRDKLLREGYPFAKVAEPDVVVDHDTRAATLSLGVDPGPLRRFGQVRVIGDRAPFDSKHANVIARFEPGELYDQADVDDLRRAMVATGIVGSVNTEVVEGATPGTVDIVTRLEPAPYRTLAAEAGYGTGEGFRLEASWQHRNLIRPEGAVTLRGIAGTREQLLGAALRMNNFRKRDQALNARVLASHTRYAAYDARTFQLGGSFERQSNILFQKKWTWSVGAELLASDERDFVEQVGRQARRTYFIGALPGYLGYDGTDDLLDPRQGFRLAGRLSPEASLQGRASTYVRSQLDGSYYQPVSSRVTVAGRVRLGSIFGAAQDNIAPSRLNYAGGGGSVRGYGYQSVGPRNALNEPTGGRSLAEFSLEARVRLPILGGNFGVVPFVDAGNVYPSAFPKFTDLQYGAGIGVRYYSLFGPIRVDVATPLNRRPGDSRLAVYVSLGQAF